jgi:hypothetical protein
MPDWEKEGKRSEIFPEPVPDSGKYATGFL